MMIREAIRERVVAAVAALQRELAAAGSDVQIEVAEEQGACVVRIVEPAGGKSDKRK